MSKINHLAGIIPIGGQPLDYNLPWNDSLIPIAQNYLAVERAAIQCVLAGCETIWIVGHLGTQPLIRKRVGDIIVDPIYLQYKDAYKKIKEVSIYYVPIHPRDKERRDSLGWSVLYGADNAFRVSRFISKWIEPEKFFCCFPYGIVPDENLRDNRKLISSSKKIFYTYKGETVKNNLHLPFTFDAGDYFRCRDMIKSAAAIEWGIKVKPKYYDLATVFKGVDETEAEMIELPWFYDISNWDSYKSFLSSEHNKLFNKPTNLFKGNQRGKYKNEQDNRENLQSNEPTIQE